MKFFHLFLFVVVLSFLAGCSKTVGYGQFTVASSNNVRNLNYSQDSAKQRVSGEICVTYIFGISSGKDGNRLQEAMDDAIRNGQKSGLDGDILVNVRMYRKVTNFPFGHSECEIVEGDLVKIN